MDANDILASLESEDANAVIGRVITSLDSSSAGKALVAAATDAYWKQKNLARSTLLLREGIREMLRLAESSSEEIRLKTQARAMAYNLASFTWPGWDEPGIVCSAGEQAIGLEAAHMSLRLSRELQEGHLKESRGLWMLGAHQLGAGDFTSAIATFQSAAAHAFAVNEQADKLLAEAFAALSNYLSAPEENAASLRVLDIIRDALRSREHGEMFIAQIDTARKVFASPR